MQMTLGQHAFAEPLRGENVRPCRVLLLEDSQFDQRRITRCARETGLLLEIDIVSGLDQLTKLIDHTRYDVVLLDYRLPAGSGFDALTQIRKSRLNAKCAAIMIAGDDALDDGATRMRHACDAALGKDNLNAETLKDALRDALGHKVDGDLSFLPNSPASTELTELIQYIKHAKFQATLDGGTTIEMLDDIEMQVVRIWNKISAADRLDAADAGFVSSATHGTPGRQN